jgi:hypothetical protein
MPMPRGRRRPRFMRAGCCCSVRIGMYPRWITAPLAGYVVQWHFSLQHEAIHSMRGIPKWLRRALVWPPIGIWFPFELYR